MTQIHIIDGQKDVILDYIVADEIIEDAHKKSLVSTIETYDFRTFADKRYSEFLEKRNRLIIPDEDGSLREFVIFEAHRYRDSEGYKSQVYAHGSYLELNKATVIYPNSFTGSPSQHGGRALNDTGWQMGVVEVSGNRKITIDKHTNPFEVIKRIAKDFSAELRFRIEHDGNRVVGRYVDMLERVGTWQGREAEFGKDLDSIKRVEKQDVVTALLGLGPDREDGTRLEVIEEDEDALQRWGRIGNDGELNHLIEAYEIQSDRTEMTEAQARQYTRTALNKRINTQVTFETTIVDLENVVGMENKKIRFGDTIKIKDEKFNPPLYLEARVFEMTRSIKRKDKTEIKLGDYIEHTEEQVNAIWTQLQDEIRKRFDRMVIANIESNGGDIFKNGEGSTELYVRTFVGGAEVDEDGEKYDYQWMKYDMEGNHLTDFYDTGKTLMVYATDIAEKATYRVLISIDLEVVNITEITLSNVFDGTDGGEGTPGKDGEDGKDGKDGHTPVKGTDYFDGVDGQDGQSSYLWIRYSQNENGDPMTTDPLNAKYIGVATTQTPNAPNHYNSYTWSLVKGTDGVPGEEGEDGKTSYLHIKYSNDGGNTFTADNGEAVGEWIGTYVDFTQADSNDVAKYTWNKVKGEKGEPGERGVQGLQGKDGSQGIPGAKGADGRTSYTHIAYADNAQGGGFSQSPTGKAYVGMYVDFVQADSNDASKYKWSLIKGADGTQGIAGPKGADGKTPYFHTAWANNATGTSGFSTTVSANKLYIGTYTDFVQADSSDPGKYNWTKIKGDKGDKGEQGAQGIQGPKGVDGTSQYVHIRYSANANGNPMTVNPAANTQYIGLANTTSATAPAGYASYSWAKFKGEQGNQGIAGAPGVDGKPTYTWVKYADNAQGSGMSDSPDGKLYIGLAFNKPTATESNVASQYDWSLMPQNIEIGGRNLMFNTTLSLQGNVERLVPWTNKVSITRSDSADFGESFALVRSTEALNNEVIGVETKGDRFNVVEGVTYTLSFIYLNSSLLHNDVRYTYIMRETGANQSLRLKSNEEVGIAFNSFVVRKAVFTFTADFTDSSSWFLIGSRASTAGDVWLRVTNMQLERGNVATDWTPAPEDAEKAIQDVKTTADGKNSIFYATAQPATTGRKIGDVWFKTNADNKMYRFNGSTWVEALIGEQAIVADSITANHIKSLNGLNVNNQFTVDNNGNVTFKGNLTGASGTFSGALSGATGTFSGALSGASGSFKGDVSGSTGTFGQVTVNEGDLTVKDKTSNVKSLVTPLPNLIGDHNFELSMPDFDEVDEASNWVGFLNPAAASYDFNIHKPYWTKAGQPKIAWVPYYGNTDHRAKPIFDSQAIVVRNANFVRQHISEGLGSGGTYTISGHFKRHWGKAAGIPRFEVDHRRGSTLVSRLINNSYTKVPNDYSVVRYATSFTLPSTFKDGDSIEIKVSGGDANWVQADGIQLVRGTIPCVYDMETTAFNAMNAFKYYPERLWSGTYDMSAAHRVTPAMPLSQCRNGWALSWQGYNATNGVVNSDFQTSFITKAVVTMPGFGHRYIGAAGTTIVNKYVYVTDTQIIGYAQNGGSGNPNQKLVLTEVFEW